MSHDPAAAVFYDGSCPLCRAEIGYYRRRAGADAVQWIDISWKGMHEEVAPGLSCGVAMQRFHVETRSGQQLSGGAAFAALWQALPAFALLGRVMARQPMLWLLEQLYRGFLPIRPYLQRLFR